MNLFSIYIGPPGLILSLISDISKLFTFKILTPYLRTIGDSIHLLYIPTY